MSKAVRSGADESGADRPEPDWSILSARPDVAARALLGCRIAAHGVTVRLSEVEAYSGIGEDPASHAHRGRTPRTGIMFGPPGFSYIYFTYGMHWCLNIVTSPPGVASGVLLRAGEVIEGQEIARVRRTRSTVPADRDLARGPARLTSAMGLDGSAGETSMLDGSGPIRLLPRLVTVNSAAIRHGPRVGVTSAYEREWRFWLDGDPTVSPYRRHQPKSR
jgi:DNA-3-methyladenine glycosylase